jgi:AcrR family transcriptional regulator
MAIESDTRTDARSSRMPASERRELIIKAAVIEFANKGLHGTATEDIARRAGITQPYVFRLFGTKKALFIAVVEHCFDTLMERFQAAIAGIEPGDGKAMFDAMGESYAAMVQNRTELLMQMQAYAACADDDVRAVVQRRYGELYRWVEDVTGGDDLALHSFFSTGMLMNVATAIDLMSVAEPWVANCFAPPDSR